MGPEHITNLLRDLATGRDEARDQLLPLVYEELRALAHRKLSGRREQTLSTTDLVHEAYLKLFGRTRLALQDRRHFFAVAARAMRQVIVDHARRARAQKRGGGLAKIDLDPSRVAIEDRTAEILAIDQAVHRLVNVDERLARVVELRFFGGLSVAETAEVLDVDERTVRRDWREARALLHRELDERPGP